MSIKGFSQLTNDYPYKVELHSHTTPASPCSDMTPGMLVERYQALGFDGIVITNHFVHYLLKSEDPQKVSDAYLKDCEFRRVSHTCTEF